MDQYRNTDLVKKLKEKITPNGDVAFAFFDPWAVLTGRAREMLQYLALRNILLLAYSYKTMTEGDVENIYRKNSPISSIMSWHIPEKVCSMGVSLGLLLYSPNELSIEKILKEIKGKSDPLLNFDDGVFRRDFRAPNKSLSLMHSSDDWHSTLVESLVFFSPWEIESACRKRSTEYAKTVHSRFCEDFISEGAEYIKEVAPTILLTKIRLRAIKHLPQEFPGLIEIKRLWINYLNSNPESNSIQDEFSRYMDMNAEEKRWVEETDWHEYKNCGGEAKRWYVTLNEPNRIHLAIPILSNLIDYPLLDTFWFCERFPLFNDKWEKLLFQTTLFHFNFEAIYAFKASNVHGIKTNKN